MDELLLPERVLRKASVTPNGEHAWRAADVAEVVAAAREAGLACLGGQPQFRLADATCEPIGLNFDPDERLDGESWDQYVRRSADRTIALFTQVIERTDFRGVAIRDE